MRKKIIILSLFLLAISTNIFAQTSLDWAFNTENLNDVQIGTMQTIGEHTYITGQYREALKIDKIELKGKGTEDIFLFCIDKNGQTLWAKSIGWTGFNKAHQLAKFDKSLLIGGILKTGHNKSAKANTNKQAIFISSYDSIGKQDWTIELPFKGKASLDVIETWNDNLILVGGSLRGEITIDKENINCSNTSSFALIFSSEGKLQDFIFSKGTGKHRNIASKFDSNGNLYLLTAISPGTYSYGSTNKTGLYNASSNTLILSKFNTPLEQLWTTEIVGDAYIEGIELQVDNENNILLCLNYNGSVFSSGLNLQTDSKLASAILKLDTNGEILWSQAIQSPKYCRLFDFTIQNNNSILLSGYNYAGLNINEQTSEDRSGNQKAFLLQVDNEGQFLWLENINEETRGNFGKAISFDDEGCIYFAGGYMDNDTCNKPVRAKTGHTGLFINRYHICDNISLKIQASSTAFCPGDSINIEAPEGFASYTWNDSITDRNNIVINQAGRYSLLAKDSKGCILSDSINIEESELTEILLGEDTELHPEEYLNVEVENKYDEYYWSDNYNSLNRTIEYRSNQEQLSLILYAKENNFCLSSDTITISFNDYNLEDGFSVYPNPVKENIWWNSDINIDEEVIIELFDARKTLLFEQKFNNVSAQTPYNIPMSSYMPGNYYIRIRTKNKTAYKTFVKQ